jgi:hypothetical protein
VSVFVEGMCLVVPRILLDDRYPGGTRGYLQWLAKPSSEARYVIADPHLVCASYLDVYSAERAALPLLDYGFVELDNETFHDFAIVDQELGSTRPCLWLLWNTDSSSITCAWFSGADKGELVTPPEWSLDRPSRLKRTDIRDMPGRALRLSVEDSVETWLDFDTGRIVRRSGRGWNAGGSPSY